MHPITSCFLRGIRIGVSWIALVMCVCCSETSYELELALARAQTAQAMGRPDWVRHYLTIVLEKDPENADLWKQLGDAYLAGFEGSVQSAISAYQHCLQNKPDNPEAVKVALAKAFALQGDMKTAATCLDGLSGIPNHDLLRSKYLLHQDADLAWNTVEKVLNSSEGVPDASYLEAAEIARVRQDWENVRRFAEKARKFSPLEPAAAYLLVQAANHLGDQEAQKTYAALFAKLKEFQTAPSATLEQAKEKLALLRALEDTWPAEKEELWAHQLFWQLKAKELSATETSFKKLGDFSTLGDRDLLDLASGLMQANQVSRTEILLNQLSQRRQISQKEYVLIWAQWAISTRRYEEVEKRMTEMLRGPEPIAAYYFWRATAKLWQNDEASAEKDLREAVNLAPWFGNYRIALAKLLLGKGQRDMAKTILLDPLVATDPAVVQFVTLNQLE